MAHSLRELAAVELIPVEVQEELLAPARQEYYLLAWRAPAAEAVETVPDESAHAAVEYFLLPGLSACTPYPPWRDSTPVAPEYVIPTMWLAVTRDGREFVVGHADSPTGRAMTHGELWASFNSREIEEFHAHWKRLRRPM